jgi:hypothetical protein
MLLTYMGPGRGHVISGHHLDEALAGAFAEITASVSRMRLHLLPGCHDDPDPP